LFKGHHDIFGIVANGSKLISLKRVCAVFDTVVCMANLENSRRFWKKI